MAIHGNDNIQDIVDSIVGDLQEGLVYTVLSGFRVII